MSLILYLEIVLRDAELELELDRAAVHIFAYDLSGPDVMAGLYESANSIRLLTLHESIELIFATI